ncbi:hypothetical protein JL722_7517 [Aureococcus anophagefferens]|nr:hypothetical protein JL722_7517 [Aureococcus anophagefferens]
MIASIARAILLACVAHGFVAPAPRHGFVAPITRRQVALRAAPITAPIVEKLRDVTEPAARDLAAQYEAADLPSSRTAYVKTSATSGPALVLVHGFDSSALEFRRLLPELGGGRRRTRTTSRAGASRSPRASTSPRSARSCASSSPRSSAATPSSSGVAGRGDLRRPLAGLDDVGSVALLDPQCFIDGAPPVPEFAARFGVRVLRSWPLRALANIVAYFDKSLGTDDAIRVGLLHCERPGWEDDAVAWVNGGGYAISAEVAPALEGRRTLVLWGDNDEILPPKDNVPRFADALPEADVRFVRDCGHVPHLEQPRVTADVLAAFAGGGAVPAVAGLSDARGAPAPRDAVGVVQNYRGPVGAGASFDWTGVSREPLGDDRAAYKVRRFREARDAPRDGDVTVRWSAPITIAGLLFFFPLFFMDTFFAISRGFICASRNVAIADLCSPIAPRI